MEFSKHNWAMISETICPEMFIFDKYIVGLRNFIFMTSHFSTLYLVFCM